MSEMREKSELVKSREIKQNGTAEEREQAVADQIIRIGDKLVNRVKGSDVDHSPENRKHGRGQFDELYAESYGHDSGLEHMSDKSNSRISRDSTLGADNIELRKTLLNNMPERFGRELVGDELRILAKSKEDSNRQVGEPALSGSLIVNNGHKELATDETAHAAAGILNNMRGEIAKREIVSNMSDKEQDVHEVDRILKT